MVARFLFVSTAMLYLPEVHARMCYYYDATWDTYTYHYCEHDQSCCGSSCCYTGSVYHLWYFWICLAFSILACATIGGLCYRKKLLRQNRITTVNTISSSVPPPPPSGHLVQPPPYPGTSPPPPYSQQGYPPPMYPTYPSTGMQPSRSHSPAPPYGWQ
ncbi:uncharacterized protein LOC144434586 [Glandiceps talaboti]